MRKHILAAGLATVSSGIAVALMGVSPAAAGVAGITTQIVTTTVTAPADNTAEAEATCPAGELLMGGGYSVNSTATSWRVYVDAPLNSTTWLVEPVNFSAQTLSFSAYAICAMSVPGKKAVAGFTTHVVGTSVSAPANDTAEADATCPAGQLLTGGGYDVFNVSANWSIFTSAPLSNDAWNVEIDNEVPATTMFDSYAVCLAKTNSKPITGLAVSTVETGATVQGNSVQNADASCGPKTLMTGGGHEIASIGQDWSIQASEPVTTKDWRVRAASLDSSSRNFDSFAVCLAKA
jgi:hypothetical protein